MYSFPQWLANIINDFVTMLDSRQLIDLYLAVKPVPAQVLALSVISRLFIGYAQRARGKPLKTGFELSVYF